MKSDVVEVIRCENCEWCDWEEINGDHFGTCQIRKNSWGNPLERGYLDFCSDGKRREE